MMQSAADAVEAVKSISTMAWDSISPGKSHLFSSSGLTDLGNLYFETCRRVTIGGGSEITPTMPPVPAPTPAQTNPTTWERHNKNCYGGHGADFVMWVGITSV